MNKKEIKLSNGMEMPRLGMGTWFLGENRSKDAEETAALRAGIDAGIRLIDTAEMYGDGRSEQLIGRAIQGYDRSRLFLVSKGYPHNAGRRKIFKSLQQTLKNLQTDYLDLYLLLLLFHLLLLVILQNILIYSFYNLFYFEFHLLSMYMFYFAYSL